MDKIKKNHFRTLALGELKILGFIGEVALLEKAYDAKEKYIIAINFDIENNCWDSGIYYTSFQEAFEEFRKRVYMEKNIDLSEKKDDFDLDI